MILNINGKVKLGYTIEQIRDGKVIRKTPLKWHMITDTGLDGIGSGTWASLLSPIFNLSFGDASSPTPVRRDSGIINLSQSGNTVTASANFFSGSDVGRLIKYGASGSSGAECYITGYTNPTTVTVNTSATVSAQPGVVWYVNRAQVDAFVNGIPWNIIETSQLVSDRSVTSNVLTSSNTWVRTSDPFPTNRTLTEIGFGSWSGSGLYDRDIISPPVAMLIGDQARVTVVCTIYYDVTPSIAVSNFGTGWNTSGTFQFEGFSSSATIGNNANSPIPEITNGGSISTGGLFGTISTGTGIIALITGNTNLSLQAFSLTGSSPSRTLSYPNTATLQSYTSGTYYRDKVHAWNTSSANGTIYGIQLTDTNFAGRFWGALIFNTPQTKTNTQVVNVTTRISWSRILVN